MSDITWRAYVIPPADCTGKEKAQFLFNRACVAGTLGAAIAYGDRLFLAVYAGGVIVLHWTARAYAAYDKRRCAREDAAQDAALQARLVAAVDAHKARCPRCAVADGGECASIINDQKIVFGGRQS